MHLGNSVEDSGLVTSTFYLVNNGTTAMSIRQALNDVEMYFITTTEGVFGTLTAHDLSVRTTNAERHRITAAGKHGFGNIIPDEFFDLNYDLIRIRNSKTPASATDAGRKGSICWDSGYIYVCVDTNTWERAALAPW